jgi:hypothetical protein
MPDSAQGWVADSRIQGPEVTVNRKLVAALVAASAILGSGAAEAALITIDPDAFAAGTLLTNAFPGLTLRSIGAGFDGDSDADIYGRDPLAFLEPYNASTGGLVFGTNDPDYPHLFGGTGAATFRVDFASPVSLVRLDGISNDESDAARLQAYNSSNVLLATYTTASLGTSAFETMIVSSAASDIAYVVASGVSGDSVGFDRLQYEAEAVPEPTTLALFGAGLVALRARRKRSA